MLGFEQSWRDDLESIGYLMVYFLKGELPWQNISCKNKDELYKAVLKMKLETPVNVLTKGLPEEFKDFLNLARSMEFDTEPSYSEIRQNFQKLFRRKGYTNDNVFDWDIEEEHKLEQRYYSAYSQFFHFSIILRRV